MKSQVGRSKQNLESLASPFSPKLTNYQPTMVMIVKVAILLLLSADNAYPNFPIAPNCGWNSCGTSFRGDRPDTSDDFVWLNIDMCNFIAYKKGTCCCFAGDIGV